MREIFLFTEEDYHGDNPDLCEAWQWDTYDGNKKHKEEPEDERGPAKRCTANWIPA